MDNDSKNLSANLHPFFCVELDSFSPDNSVKCNFLFGDYPQSSTDNTRISSASGEPFKPPREKKTNKGKELPPDNSGRTEQTRKVKLRLTAFTTDPIQMYNKYGALDTKPAEEYSEYLDFNRFYYYWLSLYGSILSRTLTRTSRHLANLVVSSPDHLYPGHKVVANLNPG